MKKYLLILLVGFTLAACKHDIPEGIPIEDTPITITEECSSDSVYFQEQILPILMGCAVTDCHDAASHEEDVILDNYANIISTGDVEPGDPDESKIYEKITDDDPDDIMPPPPGNPLSEQSINLIYDWIAQGALNNSCPDALCDTLEVTFSQDIYPLVDAFCMQCHSGIMPYGVIHISDYDEIVEVASGSTFLDIIDGNVEEPMPFNTNGLTDCQVRMFEMWIENGMPND